jgi:alcohol dehydrogenase class IV
MRFEFATATRIIFGRGTCEEVGPLAGRMGGCAFVVTGRTGGRARGVLDRLRREGIKCVTFSVAGEPTNTIVKEAAEQGRAAGCDLVVGIGGGSVVDTGKAVAAMVTNNSGDGSGGNAERGAGGTRAQGQGEHAKLDDAAGGGGG